MFDLRKVLPAVVGVVGTGFFVATAGGGAPARALNAAILDPTSQSGLVRSPKQDSFFKDVPKPTLVSLTQAQLDAEIMRRGRQPRIQQRSVTDEQYWRNVRRSQQEYNRSGRGMDNTAANAIRQKIHQARCANRWPWQRRKPGC